LSHIKGFVSSLRRTDVHWDEATRRDFLAEIEVETDRLAELVDPLIQASGANGAKSCVPTRAPATVTALIEDGLHRVRCPRNRQVSVTVPAGLPVLCVDPDGIGRVLANLVQNAVKYSPPTSVIWISARLVGHSRLELSVQDEGSGVAVEDRQRIFEPFFRTRTSVLGNSPGHGLGLAICKSIVLAHGGSIKVDERPGGGASFKVVLPVALRPGRLGDGREMRMGAMTQQTILVVDDEAPMRKHPFDLMLLGISLPSPDGLQVLEAIRRDLKTPVMMLSGRGPECDTVGALDLGADHYLTKPFGYA
jgi:K+-sensing histidine kinase KdpD